VEVEAFKYTLSEINKLSDVQKEILEEYLLNMEQTDLRTIKEYENYIKNNYNAILEITFGTRNKNTLAHQCRYIIEIERHCEWTLSVAGVSTPTFFGWFK
jgi:hypothetical protein